MNKPKIEKTRIAALNLGSSRDSLRPGGRPRNESGPAGDDFPGEKASPPPSDAEIEGRLRFPWPGPWETTALSGRVPQGFHPGAWTHPLRRCVLSILDSLISQGLPYA